MIPTLRHLQHLLVLAADDPVHQPMLVADSARPPACYVAAERFGLIDALKRMMKHSSIKALSLANSFASRVWRSRYSLHDRDENANFTAR